MFLLPFLFGLAPIKASKLKNAERFTKIANCFGGGVFFGTCFLHLIPEVKCAEGRLKLLLQLYYFCITLKPNIFYFSSG